MIVYERNVEVGGLLRYGIPTMKLGKDVCSLHYIYIFISLSLSLSVCLSVRTLNSTLYSQQLKQALKVKFSVLASKGKYTCGTMSCNVYCVTVDVGVFAEPKYERKRTKQIYM